MAAFIVSSADTAPAELADARAVSSSKGQDRLN